MRETVPVRLRPSPACPVPSRPAATGRAQRHVGSAALPYDDPPTDQRTVWNDAYDDGVRTDKPIKIPLEGIGGLLRGGDNVLVAWSARYNGDVKKLTITEFARMGGKARAKKLTPEQLSAIGKMGGRPRKVRRLDSARNSTPNP